MTESALEANCGSLMPGETRTLSVHLRASAAACSVAYDSSAVIRDMEAVYTGAYSVSGSYKRGVFTVPDPSVIDLPAHDVRIAELTVSPASQCKGRTAVLQARCHNGAAPATDVRIDFFALINGCDTVAVASRVVARMEAGSDALVSAAFLIPDTTESIEFFAVADPRNLYGEFCEFNNVLSVASPLLGPDWILDVDCYPNPVDDRTVFSWQLPGDMRDLTLVIHSFDGRQVGIVRGLPAAMGRHSVEWLAGDVPAGLYIYSFEGTDHTGTQRRHSGKLLKME
jgi:hypothetical protein